MGRNIGPGNQDSRIYIQEKAMTCGSKGLGGGGEELDTE